MLAGLEVRFAVDDRLVDRVAPVEGVGGAGDRRLGGDAAAGCESDSSSYVAALDLAAVTSAWSMGVLLGRGGRVEKRGVLKG
jgi:hypothetical protein